MFETYVGICPHFTRHEIEIQNGCLANTMVRFMAQKRKAFSRVAEITTHIPSIAGTGYDAEINIARDLTTFLGQCISKGMTLNVRRVTIEGHTTSAKPHAIAFFCSLYDANGNLTNPYESTSETDHDPLLSHCDQAIEWQGSRYFHSYPLFMNSSEVVFGAKFRMDITTPCKNYARKFLQQADQGSPPGFVLESLVRQNSANQASIACWLTLSMEYTTTSATPLSF